jgi:CSLREA domain-containing protein
MVISRINSLLTQVFVTAFTFLSIGIITSSAQNIYIVNSIEDQEDMDLSDAYCADHLGRCTLRAAIQNANKSIFRDEIYFDLPEDKIHFIHLEKSLPPIIYPILIEGKNPTQKERLRVNIFLDGKNLYHEDKLPYFPEQWIKVGLYLKSKSNQSIIRGLGFISFTTHALLVETDGNTIQGNQFGFFDHDPKKENRNGVTVFGKQNLIGGIHDDERNYFIYNLVGIGLFGHDNSIIGNYIGVKDDGKSPAGNLVGIDLTSSSKYNLITNNLISSNFLGITNGGSGIQIFKNLIGTDAKGSKGLGNYVGLNLRHSGKNTKVGAKDKGNLISGNEIGILIRPTGVDLELDRFSDIEIKSNKIGTDISGSFPIGNKKGIIIKNKGGVIIGGSEEADGNLISGNIQAGIEMVDVFDAIIKRNIIGLDIHQMNPIPNFHGIYLRDTENSIFTKNNIIVQNLISANYGSGIYIGKGWSNLGIFSNLMGVTKLLPKKLPNSNWDILSYDFDNEYCIGGESANMKNILHHGIGFLNVKDESVEEKILSSKNYFLMIPNYAYQGFNKKLKIPPLLKIENLYFREAINFYTFQLIVEQDKFVHDYYLRLSSEIVED